MSKTHLSSAILPLGATRSGVLFAAIVAIVTTFGVPGCRDPKLKDGFPCSASRECPSPFKCAADNKCYRQIPVGNDAGDQKDTGPSNPDLSTPEPDGGGSATGGATGSGGAGGAVDPGTAGTSGTGGSGVVVTPGSVEAGLPCLASGDCKSTFCRDSVCCAAKCDGACMACAEAYTGMANGTCAPSKDGMDPHDSCVASAPETCGNDGQCNGMGACRKHGSNQTCAAAACTGAMFMPARSCDGAGTCAASTAVGCGTFPCTTSGCAKPCTDAAECGAGSFCAAGTCKAQKQNGETCSAVGECGSGKCVDGVCCDTACTGACQSCSEMATGQRSGRCQPVQAGQDPDNECPTDAPAMCGRDGTCDGSGACRKYDSTTTCVAASCSGTMFTPARKCAAGACVAATAVNCGTAQCAVEGCRQGCTIDTECSAGAYCAAGSCAAKKGNGSTCVAGNECVNAACIDGFCCETACAGKCYACSMTKTGQANGKCAAIGAGNDPDNECAAQAATTCGTDGACNGAGACRLFAQGVECAAGMCNTAGNYLSARTCDGLGTCAAATTDVCAPNVCAATGCNRTCTMDAQCVGSTYCAGTSCAAKKTTGTACTAANQCVTNNCIDGFCCDGTCTGKCSACSMAKTGQANGKCAAIPTGQDPDSECAMDAAKPCDLDGWCNGSGACRLAANTAPCGTAMCANPNTFTPAGLCDGAGMCNPGAQRICSGGFTCASTSACRTACTAATSTTDCAAGNYCTATTNGTCAPKKGNGVTCTSGTECANGFCSADGHCCNVACNASGGCQSCTSGTCTTSGATVCNNACVNTATDAANCSACGNACAKPGFPNGAATCSGGACVPGCAANYLYCTSAGDCRSAIWDWETQNVANYTNGSESPAMISTAQHHLAGSHSMELVPAYGTGNQTDLNFNTACGSGFEIGGKTVTAWTFVNADWGSFNARCRFMYYDQDAGLIVGSPYSTPGKNAWVKMTHTFPATTFHPGLITVDCLLPMWDQTVDPTPVMRLYVDDFSIAP